MKKKLLVAGIFTGLFVCLALALKNYDVANIGPQDSSVGFSHVNQGVFNIFGANKTCDKITDICIVAAILAAIAFVGLGIYQLVKRKKIKKVDSELFVLAGLYAATGIFYLLFEKVFIVNYRPVLEKDALAASFPSTHTLISCVILWSTAILLEKYIKDVKKRRLLQAACVVLSLVISFGRILAGMHWLTDVLGGMFLSAALVFVFWSVLDYRKK